MADMDKLYDVLVLGGGPAGLNAALYAVRKGLDVLVLSLNTGGQVNDTAMIENYLGYKEVMGYELAQNFREHLEKFEVPIVDLAVVSKYERDGINHRVSLEDGRSFLGKTVVVTLGSYYRKLGVPGEEDFAGRGVSYCAICDAPFYRNKEVLIVGGGNAAVEAALDLSKYANSVTLLHRSQFRADKILLDEMFANPKITYHLRIKVEEIFGDDLLRGVKTINLDSGEEKIFNGDGLFIEIGQIPNSQIFENILDMTDSNSIITDESMATSIPGVFAAGNIRNFPYQQIIIAASEGAIAGLAANDYLIQSYGK